MIHALAEFVFVAALSLAVGAIFYTVGRHSEDICEAIRGRLMR